MSKLSKLFDQFASLVLFDVETNGLDPEKDQIIELAALRAYKDGRTEELDVFIKLPAGQKLPARIVDLTNITDDMLATEGMEPAEAARSFCKLLEPPDPLVLIAHNAQFDLLFVMELLKKHRAAPQSRLKALDTLTVYKDRASYPHKLEDAIAHYNLSDKATNSHRAIDDVRALYEVLKAMDNERDDLDEYVNLFGYNPKYGVSGRKLREITYLAQSYYNTSRLPDVARTKGVRR